MTILRDRIVAPLLLTPALAAVLVAGTAGSSSADGTNAPVLPKAQTGKALYVSGTAAVLSGTVNARGRPTRYKFQYGPSRPYAQGTATGEEYVVGHRTEIVSEAAIDLKPGTTYHYRILAFNGHGVSAGKDRTFKTHK